MRTSTPWLSGKPAAMVVLMLLFLGCGGGPPPLQTIALTGSTAEIGRFEGRWFDSAGDLVAVVSSQGKPRFEIQLPKWFHLRDASFQEGQLVFHVRSEGPSDPIPARLTWVREDRGVIVQILPPEFEKSDFICGTALAFPGVDLVRDPSPWWHAKRSAEAASKRIGDSYIRTYNAVWDRLARIF